MNKWLSLLASVLVCLSAGVLGSLFVTSDSPWYAALEKPFFSPPGWVFAPVWTFLYVTMGVAAWLVLRLGRPGRLKAWAMVLFATQLVLNAAWTPVFFGLREIGWAIVVLYALWAAVLACGVLFTLLYRAAGLLMLPYFLWVGFAGMLNGAIWLLNR